jgi:hypothetical protein
MGTSVNPSTLFSGMTTENDSSGGIDIGLAEFYHLRHRTAKGPVRSGTPGEVESPRIINP